MSYDATENSIQDGTPKELYKFVVGSTAYSYTSAQEAQSVNTGLAGADESYTPLEMQRSDPEQGKELARQVLTVQVPRNSDIANQFVAFVPSKRVYLSIYRTHTGGADYVQLWKGRVRSASWKEDGTADLECAPTLMSLKRQGLRKNFGSSCQHALYDSGCGVLKADFATSVLVSDVDTTVITGTGEIAATSEPDWFVSGYAERANGEKRFVIAQSGDTIEVLFPFTALAPGETITVYAGCKRDIDTCFNKFNTTENPDAANFFGFHVNPKKNPFQTGLN